MTIPGGKLDVSQVPLSTTEQYLDIFVGHFPLAFSIIFAIPCSRATISSCFASETIANLYFLKFAPASSKLHFLEKKN